MCLAVVVATIHDTQRCGGLPWVPGSPGGVLWKVPGQSRGRSSGPSGSFPVRSWPPPRDPPVSQQDNVIAHGRLAVWKRDSCHEKGIPARLHGMATVLRGTYQPFDFAGAEEEVRQVGGWCRGCGETRRGSVGEATGDHVDSIRIRKRQRAVKKVT